MELLFLGQNTPEQAQGAIRAIQAMILDTDGWPLTVELAFSEDPDPSTPNEFAVTNQLAYNHFVVSFRSDAPHFQNGGGAYDITRFYYETVVHELGHVLTFAMNDVGRGLLSQLFGVENSVEAWYPASLGWANRAGEAIAETFKDAFLPMGFRAFDNRTNIKLNYPFFPLFRAIFRNAVTEGLLRDAESMLELPPGTLGSVPTISLEGGSAWPKAVFFVNGRDSWRFSPHNDHPLTYNVAAPPEWESYSYDGGLDLDSSTTFEWTLHLDPDIPFLISTAFVLREAPDPGGVDAINRTVEIMWDGVTLDVQVYESIGNYSGGWIEHTVDQTDTDVTLTFSFPLGAYEADGWFDTNTSLWGLSYMYPEGADVPAAILRLLNGDGGGGDPITPQVVEPTTVVPTSVARGVRGHSRSPSGRMV